MAPAGRRFSGPHSPSSLPTLIYTAALRRVATDFRRLCDPAVDAKKGITLVGEGVTTVGTWNPAKRKFCQCAVDNSESSCPRPVRQSRSEEHTSELQSLR